jgi:hypothetical protein
VNGYRTNSGPSNYACLIEIVNRSDAIPINKIRIVVLDHGIARFNVGPIDLAPGQSKILGGSIDRTERCGGEDILYEVSYERDSIASELLMPSRLTQASTGSSTVVATSIGGVIGVVSAMVAALLTHLLTISRERLKERRDRFGRMEPLFNEFFVSWGRSLLAQDLQRHFDELQRKVSLSQAIVDQYRVTYRVLANSNTQNAEKSAAATMLEENIRKYINECNPDN